MLFLPCYKLCNIVHSGGCEMWSFLWFTFIAFGCLCIIYDICIYIFVYMILIVKVHGDIKVIPDVAMLPLTYHYYYYLRWMKAVMFYLCLFVCLCVFVWVCLWWGVAQEPVGWILVAIQIITWMPEFFKSYNSTLCDIESVLFARWQHWVRYSMCIFCATKWKVLADVCAVQMLLVTVLFSTFVPFFAVIPCYASYVPKEWNFVNCWYRPDYIPVTQPKHK